MRRYILCKYVILVTEKSAIVEKIQDNFDPDKLVRGISSGEKKMRISQIFVPEIRFGVKR